MHDLSGCAKRVDEKENHMKFARNALLFLLAISAALSAQARLPQSERVPANAFLAIGIDSTAATWKRIEALPVTAPISDFLTTGSLIGNEGFQSFLRNQRELGKALGFPATPAELLTNVFGNFTYYSVANPDGGQAVSVAIIGVKSKTRAAALLKRFNEDLTSGSLDSEIRLEKARIGPIDGWHMVVRQSDNAALGILNKLFGTEYFYGIAGGNLVIGNNTAAVAAAAGPRPADFKSIMTNERFNRLRAEINWDAADLSMWYDADAMLDLKPQVAESIKDLTGGKPQNNKYVVTFNVMRDGIAGRSATTGVPEPSAQNEPISMNGLKMIAPTPFFGIVFGMFDAKNAVSQTNSLARSIGPLAGVGGIGNISDRIASFEEATSISLERELAPALGNELIVAVNNLSLEAGPAQSDMAFAAKVKNEKLMRQVMTKFEKSVEKNQSADAALIGTAPASNAFTSIDADGMTIRTIRIESITGSINPAYAITNGYVVIGVAPEAVQSAVARLAGRQAGLDKSPAYAELMQMANSGGRPFTFFVFDLGRIVRTVVQPIMPFMMGQAGLDVNSVHVIFDRIVPKVTTFASVDTRQDRFVRSYMKLQMK